MRRETHGYHRNPGEGQQRQYLYQTRKLSKYLCSVPNLEVKLRGTNYRSLFVAFLFFSLLSQCTFAQTFLFFSDLSLSIPLIAYLPFYHRFLLSSLLHFPVRETEPERKRNPEGPSRLRRKALTHSGRSDSLKQTFPSPISESTSERISADLPVRLNSSLLRPSNLRHVFYTIRR